MEALRSAAVIVPILRATQPRVLFIRRASHLRRHAGQIAFPGGVAEEHEREDLLQTALRETEEELGIVPSRLEVVHALPVVETARTGFRIAPFVALVDDGPIVPERDEIEATHEIPLSAIVAKGAVHRGIERFDGRVVATWHFDHGDVHVWGATGRILHEFLRAYRSKDAPLRRALERAAVGHSDKPVDKESSR